MSLTLEERRDLLRRARHAGARAIGVTLPAPPPGEATGTLAERGAAFVTWKREGRLRGCIGTVVAHRPLAGDVESNAVAALVRDPRFPPATARDWPRLTLDISVLQAMETIRGPGDVEIGRHGVYVEKGRRAALLLPQVAPEWGWDAVELLTQVCLKAGLPPDAWSSASPPDMWRFTADVFSDEDVARADAGPSEG